uniref:Protein FAM107B n=2 Tax=Cuerna arida TaxID=1464854 RepID=A0A1B6GH96_9HEMI
MGNFIGKFLKRKEYIMADAADDIEDTNSERSPGMLSESHHSPQPPVIGLRPDPPPCPTENLIMPRKLQNPCLDSKDHQNLHRELLFNQKIGKNVLNQKSELQRAMEKHKESQIKKELELQKQENRTPFEKVIEERARRLESQEKGSIEEEPNSKPEFLQVHAKLRARMDSK